MTVQGTRATYEVTVGEVEALRAYVAELAGPGEADAAERLLGQLAALAQHQDGNGRGEQLRFTPVPAAAGARRARRRGAAHARATSAWAAAAGGFTARGRPGRRRAGWRRAGRPATAPRSSSARPRRGPISTSARCGKPPGCSTPNARHVAPLGSKSDSCSISMPSCSPERLLGPDRVAGHAVERRAGLGEVGQHLVVDAQLVGADRRERERVEDQERRAPAQVGARERRALVAREREVRRGRPGGDDGHVACA